MWVYLLDFGINRKPVIARFGPSIHVMGLVHAVIESVDCRHHHRHISHYIIRLVNIVQCLQTVTIFPVKHLSRRKTEQCLQPILSFGKLKRIGHRCHCLLVQFACLLERQTQLLLYVLYDLNDQGFFFRRARRFRWDRSLTGLGKRKYALDPIKESPAFRTSLTTLGGFT